MEAKLKQLLDDVNFRENQINLLYDLLIRQNAILHPILHLYGLSGTGKSYLTRKFMNKFCPINPVPQASVSKSRRTTTKISEDSLCLKYHVYINCKEMHHASISSLFQEILEQIQQILYKQDDLKLENLEGELSELMELDFEYENERAPKVNDCSTFLRQLKTLLSKFLKKSQKVCLCLVFDNADSLKCFSESNSLFLMLFKLNEYLNLDVERAADFALNTAVVFITEIDWQSLISDCDLMSGTESPRPFVIHFNEYNKTQMQTILQKTARNLATIQYLNDNEPTSLNTDHLKNIEFYAKTILDVFFSICKDLNEIQYLIQIYYNQVVSSMQSKAGCGNEMLTVWNNMKPFLKQALTQIYLRNSLFDSAKSEPNRQADVSLSEEFESLNIISENNCSNDTGSSQLPKLMKFLLISAYVATHNPAKYDKKLFEYNSSGKTRKTKFTAQKFQQTEDNQRAAALKTQSFEINRLMAIFLAVCSEFNCAQSINLNLVYLNLRTLKSLHFVQQVNSSYSGVDEPKYKCLLDFETIHQIATSVKFNIKQYLAEYLTI